MKLKFIIKVLTCLLVVFLFGCGGDNSQKALQKGIAKITKEKYKSAISILEKAAAEYPDNASIECNLGLAYWFNKEPEKAIKALQKADSLVKSSEPLEFIGQIYLENEEYDKAKDTLLNALKKNPDSARIYTALAVTEYYRGEFYNCEQYLKKAVEIEPDYAPALFNLAIMYRSRIGGKAKAAYYFSNYLKVSNNGPRKDIANGFVTLYKSSTGVVKKTSTGQVPAIEKKDDSSGSEAVSVKPKEPIMIVIEATKKLDNKQVDEAINLLRDGAEKYPDNADILWMQATLFDKLGQTDKAVKLYEKFKQKFPSNPRVSLIPDFSKVDVPEEKNVPEKKTGNPASVSAKKDVAESSSTNSNVVQPNQSREALAKFALHKANTLFDEGNFDAAIPEYKKVLKYNPQESKALYTLGFIYNSKKEYGKALGYFSKALKLNPNMIEARYMIAIVNYELGDNQTAKQSLLTAIEQDPFYAKAYFLLGLIYKQENNIDKSRYYLKKYINIEPDSKQAANAKIWLKSYGE